MPKMRERLLTLAVAACALALCAGPVFAALTVEIIVPPTDPFTCEVNIGEDFKAVAYVDGEQLPSGEVTWDWDFGDNSDHTTSNPTVHTYENTGNYTVTVTATYGGQQAQDSATAQVTEGEWNGEPELFCRQICTEARQGEVVCDHNWVCVRFPFSYQLEAFYMKPPGYTQWMWMPEDGLNYAPPGAPWVERRAYWDMISSWHNATYEWKAVLSNVVPPNDEKKVTGAFTPFSVVNTRVYNAVLQYDPDPESGYHWPLVPWGSAHRDPTCCSQHREFSACVKVFDDGENLIWHKHLRELSPNEGGSATWRGESLIHGSDPGSAPKGIYTYKVLVMHGDLGPEESFGCDLMAMTPYTDQEKSYYLEISPMFVDHFEWVGFDPWTAQVTLSYTLSRDAGECYVQVYRPDLSRGLLISPSGGSVDRLPLDPAAGSHEQDIKFAYDTWKPGYFWFVVFAKETEAHGKANRDLQPKWALQAVHSQLALPFAENWKEPGQWWYRDELVAHQQTEHDHVWYCAGAYDQLPLDENLETALRHDALILLYSHSGPGYMEIAGPAGTRWVTEKKWEGYDPDLDLALEDLNGKCPQLVFVNWLGCETAQGSSELGNLLDAALDAGAEVALGFEDAIDGGYYAAYWIWWFYHDSCEDGSYSVEQSAENAAEHVLATYGGYHGYDGFVVRGDTEHKLVPAHWGD